MDRPARGTRIIISDGAPLTENDAGMHRSTTGELVAEIERLRSITEQCKHGEGDLVFCVKAERTSSACWCMRCGSFKLDDEWIQPRDR